MHEIELVLALLIAVVIVAAIADRIRLPNPKLRPGWPTRSEAKRTAVRDLAADGRITESMRRRLERWLDFQQISRSEG